MKLSIVTTLYKSAPFIEEFHRRITAEAQKITEDYEIIMVDDGSPDNSLEVALDILKKDSHLRIIELSRNFGHHKAMITGLEHTSGELIFLIDVDLEEPPELLGRFYNTLSDGGWDVIYGYQEQQRKGSWFEKYCGGLAWWLVDLMLPVKIPHNHSTVRLMTRNYTQALVHHKEHKTAIGGLW
ncbi:MAG: glycosyltransferase, partial [Bacteroidetes bacterium]